MYLEQPVIKHLFICRAELNLCGTASLEQVKHAVKLCWKVRLKATLQHYCLQCTHHKGGYSDERVLFVTEIKTMC